MWEKWIQTRSPATKRELAAAYLPYLQKLARCRIQKYPASANIEVNDLVDDGMFGLMDAIERFDPSRGVKFETYSTRRILGAINDAIRSRDYLSRSERRKMNAGLKDFQGNRSLESQLPDDHKLAALIVDEQLQQELRQREGATNLVEMLRGLPAQMREVVRGYYLDGLTMLEIGRSLGLSESRVSQIHSETIEVLRERMGVRTRSDECRVQNEEGELEKTTPGA